MTVNETKLVIPDYDNNRVVQIDNINGDGWSDISGTDIEYLLDTDFDPYDIDFDAQGRIYIINNHISEGGVIRIDNMKDTTKDDIVSLNNLRAIAIDRVNGYLYYAIYSGAAQDQLHRCYLDGSNDTQLDLFAIDDIRGLAVDENGLVYIAWSTFDTCAITVYNPNVSNGIILDTKYYGSALYEEGWDVIVKSSYIYAAVDEGSGGQNKIIKFLFDTQTNELVEHDLYITDLYGPHRFIGLNQMICFIDEGIGDRLISMKNIDGDTIEYYGETGTGVGQFNFFE
jgi:hypothetical protein